MDITRHSTCSRSRRLLTRSVLHVSPRHPSQSPEHISDLLSAPGRWRAPLNNASRTRAGELTPCLCPPNFQTHMHVVFTAMSDRTIRWRGICHIGNPEEGRDTAYASHRHTRATVHGLSCNCVLVWSHETSMVPLSNTSSPCEWTMLVLRLSICRASSLLWTLCCS